MREEDKKIKAKTIAEDSEEDEEDVIVGAIKVTDEELIELPA